MDFHTVELFIRVVLVTLGIKEKMVVFEVAHLEVDSEKDSFNLVHNVVS